VQRRLTILVLAMMLAGLQYRLLGPEGVILTHQMQSQLGDRHAENQRLRSRNGTLEAEVADLKAGGPAIEATARYTLGMIKPGETFFLVVDRIDN
jgi:cell division protein FtsB